MVGIIVIAAILGCIFGAIMYGAWTRYAKGQVLRNFLSDVSNGRQAGGLESSFHRLLQKTKISVHAHAAGIETGTAIFGVFGGLFLGLRQLIDFGPLGLGAHDELTAKATFIASLFLSFVLFLALESWSLSHSVIRAGRPRSHKLSVWLQFAAELFLASRRSVREMRQQRHLEALREAEDEATRAHRQARRLHRTLNGLAEQFEYIGAALAALRLVRVEEAFSQQLDERTRRGRAWIAASQVCNLIASGFGRPVKCRVIIYEEDHTKRSRKDGRCERLRVIGWSRSAVAGAASDPDAAAGSPGRDGRDGGATALKLAEDVPTHMALDSLVGICYLLGREFWLPDDRAHLLVELRSLGIELPKEMESEVPGVGPMLLYPVPKHDDFPIRTHGVVQVLFTEDLPVGTARETGRKICGTATDLFDAILLAIGPRRQAKKAKR